MTEQLPIVDALLAERPSFHASPSGSRDEYWGIHEDVLRWLERSLPPRAVTLETGSGYSTVIFLTRATKHFVIAPDAGERDAIRNYCADKQIPTDALEFLVGGSETVLPQLHTPPLDLVLIDGDHAFPVPYLDWYYTADALKQGGLLLIDDIDVRTGKTLREFLIQEPHWRLLYDIGRTSVFEKVTAGPVAKQYFGHQPWGADKLPLPNEPWSTRLGRLRNQVRLRTRLRELLSGRR